MKKKRERRVLPRQDVYKRARAALRRLPLGLGFFLLSLAQCFSVPSPFAVCCLMALLTAGNKPWEALAGAAAGMAYRALWGLPLDAEQFMVCLICFALARLNVKKDGQVTALTGALLLLRALPSLMAAKELQTAIQLGAGVLLGGALMPGLLKGARVLTEHPKKITQDDALCLLLPALMLISGAARLRAFSVNLGYFFSAFGVLAFSWLCGSPAGACLGLGAGLALVLGGQNALHLVCLAFGALLAGMFQGKNRLAAAAAYLLASAAAAYMITLRFVPALAAAEGLAGLLFCLTPRAYMRRAGRMIRRLRWSEPRENAYIRLKMQRWVRAIDCMADALPHPRIEPMSPAEESEALTETLCAGCDRLPICWHEQEAMTREGMHALADRGEDTEAYLHIINTYFSLCPRISRIPGLLSRLDADRQSRVQRAVCAEYERDMLQTHLTALSQAAQRISLEGMTGDGEEEGWAALAEEVLQDIGFPGHTAFVKRVEGHLTVCLKYDPLALRPVAGDMLANRLSLQLRASLRVTQRQGERVILEEEPPLRVLTGTATACAVTPDRKRKPGRRPDNGDALLFRPLPGGQALLALSDGMGHGAGAQDESRKTLEMLSLCLEAGYTRSQAMTAVNGAMLSATGGEKFATVDLCVIDLWTGETAMNKLGACASFILQGQKIHTVEGAALPLGIIEHVTPMEHRFTLGEGDTLLLMSDGVTDAFREEEELLNILRRGRDMSPQQLADLLLREALMQRDGLPPDDMTVLCARVAGKERKS